MHVLIYEHFSPETSSGNSLRFLDAQAMELDHKNILFAHQ